MKLKTCPFCGAEAEETFGLSCWKIRCTVCKAEITGIDRRTNINNWNRRIEPSKKIVAQIKVDTDELIERIKEEYEIKDQPICEDAISKHDLWRIIEDNAYWVTYNETSKEKGMTLMGINQALNECPPVTPKVSEDCISRQAAIKYIDDYAHMFTTGNYFEGMMNAVDLLKQLDLFPPVEPKRPEIIRCKNCRHDNNCEIQHAAQAGSGFFCGLAKRRGEK